MIDVAELAALPLFEGIAAAQLDALIAASTEQSFGPGERLWREGEPAESWWVLLDGSIDLIRQSGREEAVVGRFDTPGRWAGGFTAWNADGTYLATGRGRTAGRLMRVPAPALRDLVAAIPLAGHIIDGLSHTARSIEAGARERQALVALGTLAAGLAHELNNPAAAAVRAVDSLQTASAALMDQLRRMADAEISPEQFAAVDRLRAELDPAHAPADALAAADREDALGDWLADHGIERSWLVGPALAASGADVAWCERVAAALPASALDPAIGWVAAALQVGSLLAEVKESTQRISGLVADVKSYSQMDRASMQEIDVTEGIDSTLVMLDARLRGGITVVRDYPPDLPRIQAVPGELNQVWTNLIDNAIDAMDGHGSLRIAVSAADDGVLVEVADTGSGMPPEVVQNAFKPFYTTKDVGKGTGLGLDISRRIVVERHGGDIVIDTGPDGTTMRVRLPAGADRD